MSCTWLRSRGSRRLSAALLALAAAVMAGCGTSVVQHDNRYAAQLQSVQQQFAASVSDIMAGTSPRAGRAATTDAVGRYEAALAKVELKLRSIRAPATVSRLHRRLIRTIDRYGAQVRRMVAALRTSDRRTLSTARNGFRAATLQTRDNVRSTVALIAATLRREPGGANP